MASSPERHLRVVDLDTGETFERCPACAELEIQLEGAQTEIRSWRSRYHALRTDLDADARKHPHWDEASKLFELWKLAAGSPDKPKRNKFSPDRFREIEPYLHSDGFERCAQAIIGRCFDHYQKARANGTTQRFFEWERIFAKGRGEFEESASRIPTAYDARRFRDSGEVVGDWQDRLDLWAPPAGWAAVLRYPRLL